ncbi:MAG: hypothetical protein V4576_01705 [Patescibacteria group bacterium]
MPTATAPQFPVIQTINLSDAPKGRTEFLAATKSYHITDEAHKVIAWVAPNTHVESVDLVEVSGFDLGFECEIIIEEFFARAIVRGLIYCPPTAAHLIDKGIKRVIATKAIIGDHSQWYFRVGEGVLDARAGLLCDPHEKWVFIQPRWVKGGIREDHQFNSPDLDPVNEFRP